MQTDFIWASCVFTTLKILIYYRQNRGPFCSATSFQRFFVEKFALQLVTTFKLLLVRGDDMIGRHGLLSHSFLVQSVKAKTKFVSRV